MGLGFGLGMSMTPAMSQRQELSVAQRQHIVQSQTLTLRLELIGAIHGGERYAPEAKCPRCGRELKPLEIFKGFNNDPNDFTTACTGCSHRFEPKLIWSNQLARMELPFYCALQTTAQMTGLEKLSPDELRKQHGATYHSAIAHYGLLKNAFMSIGIEYPFNEVADKRKKVEPFLGRLPDTVIAELSGFKVSTIRRMRRTAGIDACTHRSMVEAADDME